MSKYAGVGMIRLRHRPQERLKLRRFVDTGTFGFEGSTLDTTRGVSPPELWRQVVELVHAGTPEELVYEFGPTAQSIRDWVAQWERNAGRGDGGLTREERGKLRLRRENRQLRLAREILLNTCLDVIRGRRPGSPGRRISWQGDCRFANRFRQSLALPPERERATGRHPM
jgi:transposase